MSKLARLEKRLDKATRAWVASVGTKRERKAYLKCRKIGLSIIRLKESLE